MLKDALVKACIITIKKRHWYNYVVIAANYQDEIIKAAFSIIAA